MLSVKDITLGYGDRTLASGISFTLDRGECVLLCGPNGSGKTTLLRKLASAGGAVMVPTRIPKVKGFSVREFLRTSEYLLTDALGRLDVQNQKKADEALGALGILHLAGRDISTLSDGEFQKACIATALARDASVLLLDEPTAFLDVDAKAEVLATLRRISRDRAVLFSSHDIHEASAVCTRAMGLDGRGGFADTASGIAPQELFKTVFPSYGQAIYN